MIDRYSPIVEAKLRSVSIFAGLMNNRHEGTPKAGAVKVPVRAEASARTYNLGTGVALATPTTTYETVTINYHYAVNELMDGYVASAESDGMVAERLDSAGYALGKQIDTDILTALIATSTAADTTGATVYDKIINTVAMAKKAGVDANALWIAVSPDCYAELLESNIFQSAATLAEVENGQIGKLGGVPVFETNNTTMGSHKFIVGNRDFAFFCNEWVVPVAVNELKDGLHIGCSAVQGRCDYGIFVAQPSSVDTIFVG